MLITVLSREWRNHYLRFTIYYSLGMWLTKKTSSTYIEIPLLGGRLTVGLRTLNPPIGVRIPASQPNIFKQ